MCTLVMRRLAIRPAVVNLRAVVCVEPKSSYSQNQFSVSCILLSKHVLTKSGIGHPCGLAPAGFAVFIGQKHVEHEIYGARRVVIHSQLVEQAGMGRSKGGLYASLEFGSPFEVRCRLTMDVEAQL
jgi:hypothetical protein